MRICFFGILICLTTLCFGQASYSKIQQQDPSLPEWAVMMYSQNPNFSDVIQAYQAYYATHPFEKTLHTQYFKRWVSSTKASVNVQGEIMPLDAAARVLEAQTIRNKQEDGSRGSAIWNFKGPQHHVVSDGTLTAGFRHSNIYCHDRSATNPSLLYCGTECGGLYKSVDAGHHWQYSTPGLLVTSVTAVRIKPTDDNFVLMSAANDIWRSTDGGANWQIIGQPSFVSQDVSAWEIAFNPQDNSIIYIATTNGFFRSTDNGDNWSEILNANCETIAFKPDDPSVVYTIKYESDLGYSRFYKSTNFGASFTVYDAGWFDSTMGDIDIQGGRLATTEADPNRIYALLVGYQNTGSPVTTNGWVGTWVSNDGGATWSLPHGLIGTPYTADHPNLMNFNADDGDYTQIHYNTTMIASQLDPDKILIGGLNLWKSEDGAATYQGVGGYIGGIEYFHVDQQEYRIYKTSDSTEEIWFSNDGGIGYSNDFMATHENLNRGIYAVNLWGYDQGWNEDVMVGGRYHNGNMAYHENYADGEFLALGGGEAATGYVKYSDENKTLFSDIGGYTLPESLSQLPNYFSVGQTPNEHYWNNASSRIMFDHEYYNIAWVGHENKLFVSNNGGGSFSEAFSFGTDPANELYWMEQSYADHDYFYVQQAIGNTSKIWRSTDRGITWTEMNLPQTLRSISFTLSATNADELWLSYYDGANGNKIYRTTDAGLSWENLTTATLNDKSIWAIAHHYGTDGGVYIAMLHGLVYYRNNSMSDWVTYSSGLPVGTEPLRIVPFIRNNVVRLATWNLGVWEAPAYESSALIADFSAEYSTFFCPGDAVHFVDHSVCSNQAAYSWSFPGGVPATSTDPYPTVVYDTPGTYDVTLVVTDNGNSQTVIKPSYIGSQEGIANFLNEDFESGAIPIDWVNAGNGAWSISGDASAYGNGSYSLRFDNYSYDAQGARDDIWLGKLQWTGQPIITFDVAYAQYDNNYSDTLAVLYSTDCGETWTEVFVSGGDDLATSPDNSNFFTPASTEWENHEVAISNVEPSQEIIIAFQNRGHYGNVIYVDNINISQVVNTEEVSAQAAQCMLYPNPTSGNFNLSVKGIKPGTYRSEIFDAAGKLLDSRIVVSAGGRLEKTFTVDDFPAGLYMLQFTGLGMNERMRFEVRK